MKHVTHSYCSPIFFEFFSTFSPNLFPWGSFICNIGILSSLRGWTLIWVDVSSICCLLSYQPVCWFKPSESCTKVVGELPNCPPWPSSCCKHCEVWISWFLTCSPDCHWLSEWSFGGPYRQQQLLFQGFHDVAFASASPPHVLCHITSLPTLLS